ncbi:zinc finger FYVE domain-containing protein 26 isoform X1 [Tachyglossus aculeatus]|uniref:zinc finger FYVE domain-containing protein 26 isoform X1 n=1 Tax=Tachyglossus aculeatus TaxID=9261 RepID=UPI0018F3786B|nr:zinc finger FYVE domain-containing protein 26 isoform X1 [Tachyglossus aculeatus]
MHPFGRESAAAQDQLFGFFRGCLRRGEWELARACLPQLRAPTTEPDRLEAILRALVACPTRLRCGAGFSPQKLAWIWLLVLEKWLAWDKKLLPAPLRRETEFLLLAEELPDDISEDVLKELHEVLAQEEVGPATESVRRKEGPAPGLSAGAASALWHLLTAAPRQARALLDLLLGEDACWASRAWPLQEKLVELLRQQLRSLRESAHRSPGRAEAIYGALGALRCPPEGLRPELRLLCEELLGACGTGGSPLREERLLGCLLRRPGRGLVALYGHVYAERTKERWPPAGALGKALPEPLDPEKVMLALFSSPDPAQSWKKAYFYCLSNNKHFLEQILVTALALLKEEDFDSLGRLLAGEFRPLGRLLVLLAWTQCRSLDNAKGLLQALHRTQDSHCDSLLRDACDALGTHVEVLEWSLRQNSSVIPEKDLLRHLHSGDNHSVLYSLHHLTHLPALKEEEVAELLRKVPAADPLPDPATASVSSLQGDCQNLTLFQAFCAMKYAIYALCVNFHQHSQCQDCPSGPLDGLSSTQELTRDSPVSSGASQLVSLYLSRCRQSLRRLPVPLRLEVLENIFSLLLVHSSDLHPEASVPEDYAEDAVEGRGPPGPSPSDGPQPPAPSERKAKRPSPVRARGLPQTPSSRPPGSTAPPPPDPSFLDLKHFARGSGGGFLTDEAAMEAFLGLLLQQLEEIRDRRRSEGPELAEARGSPDSGGDTEGRLHQFSKVLSEAQWRYKVVTSNRSTDGRDRTANPSLESTSSELSTSTSEGSPSALAGGSEAEGRLQTRPQDPLVPMMLAPPESLLASCILRGNFVEAHQVVFMFGLKSSPSCGELMFMERYQEVIRELAQVERNIESQASDGGGNNSTQRKTTSTLQAIGSAAAAGMVFYSISDVTDKLLGGPGDPVPSLREDFWIGRSRPEPGPPLRDVLEDLSPPAMAAFDLACTRCQLRKTCRQLLETAERRLRWSLDSRGRKLDCAAPNSLGIRGFPAVLQQISKILSYASAPQGKPEAVEETGGSYPRCSVAELLQLCCPSLTEDCIDHQTTVSQQLEQVLQSLTQALSLPDPKGPPLSCLVEQAAQKIPEVEAHPVQVNTHLLLKNLAQQTPAGDGQTAYVEAFFNYSNTLASVLLRSLSSEPDQATRVKAGNPFVLLKRSPSQLVSHLLFERQVPPERLASLLGQVSPRLSVPQVIISCCCEPLALRPALRSRQARALRTQLGRLAQLHAARSLPDVPLPPPEGAEAPAPSPPSHPALSDPPPSFLTASALAFLKSRSKLLAVLACLGASRGPRAPKPGLSWKEFRGRREVPLTPEQVSQEGEGLLAQFPVLEAFLLTSWRPLRGKSGEGQSLAAGLCAQACFSPFLLGLHSPAAPNALTEAFGEALAADDCPRALQLLETFGQDAEELSGVKDAVLGCAAASEKDGWHYLLPVKDATLRSQLALRFADKWPLEPNLEVLVYCVSDPAVPSELKSQLRNKLQELRVYRKILALQGAARWTDWQMLRNCCVEDPLNVTDVILEAKEYGLCEEWGCLYPIPRERLIALHQKHLLHLLDGGNHDKALQLLQRITDPVVRLAVTESSLDRRPGLAASHFLANYLTTHFEQELTATRHQEIQALYVGSKVLLTLPEPNRASYAHLSARPLLLLEQLLMNMKVDWATVAVRTLRQLLSGQEIGFTGEDVDALLARYAGKALDFPYSLKERRSDSMIHLQEIFSQVSEPETLSKSPSTEFSATFPSVSILQSPGPREKSLPPSQSSTEFVPPDKPPARQEWIPDETENTCMVCRNERFTMFSRRHHCRRCGRLVCSSCSTKKMPVEGCRENPARVCDQCYGFYNKEVAEEDLSYLEAPVSPARESPPYSAVVPLPKAAELEWTLDLNEEENELVRGEFYYEQAPSSSLCIAILNLHSDGIACGHQLIEHCCSLSRGLTNPEVDAGLLTAIMKQLLFSAKMMFVKAGRSQDLALCDSYISKVDVLNILVTAAYRHVPSLDQILQPAAVTRLRNQLLEAEYYQLGVEVSTKTGLDPAGAWHAWGMACLKAGDLVAAREKFHRCLKPPFDLNQLNHGSRPVQDVVDYLESTGKPILAVQDDDYFATLKELEASLRTQSLSLEVVPEGKISHNTYYQECLFYLHNYSTNLAICSFYMRHNCMREALLHVLSKESPPDVFIEGVFLPSYRSGKLHVLENLLEAIDPTLDCWGNYLIAACQHLQKKNYYHILYELQQFMKDQVRAAMTCIRFFSHEAKTYVDLGEKLKWLLKAKDHLKVYLQEVSRGATKKKSAFFRKKMSAAEVSRHMNTVELQMEVTKFLHRCESAGTSQVTALPLPTLFGNNHMKMDVACKVMLGGKNVEEGFGIAFRVLQDFQLDAAATYCKAAQQLVKRENYGEIRQLLKCVSESGMAAENDGDTILLSCLEGYRSIPAMELEGLIQAIHSDDNKIQAYLTCSKLRSAYLIAVRQERHRAVTLVQRVQLAAEKTGDEVVKDICAQWLGTGQARVRGQPGASSRK